MKKLIYLFLALIIVAFSSDDRSDNGNDDGSGGNDNLAIGQSYQGGIIAHIDSSGQHGLIAATEDYNGKGSTNQRFIEVGDGLLDWDNAMSYCAGYNVTVGGNTYYDWYLPNKYELNLLYDQKNAIGGFGDLSYWCSLEEYSVIGWVQYFANGNQYTEYKNTPLGVRAVRTF